MSSRRHLISRGNDANICPRNHIYRSRSGRGEHALRVGGLSMEDSTTGLFGMACRGALSLVQLQSKRQPTTRRRICRPRSKAGVGNLGRLSPRLGRTIED